MLNGVYLESSTELGLVYDRYKDIPKVLNDFMNELEKDLDYSIKKQVKENYDISDRLKKFKDDCKMEMKSPKPIDINHIGKIRDAIKKTRNEIDKCLIRLGRLRKKSKYGDNVVHGILFKPKVYTNDIEDKSHENVNKFVRGISRALDWIEVVQLDLMNMCDSDLNLLSLVDKVYFRKIVESYEFDNMMEETWVNILESSVDDEDDFDSITDNYDKPPTSDDTSDDDTVEDFDYDDIMGSSISSDEEYFPVFPMGISYDYNLDRKKTTFGAITNVVTNGDEYTHSFMSFNTKLDPIIQFQINGIEKTKLFEYDALNYAKSIYVSVVFVTKDERDKIIDTLRYYETHVKDNKYNPLIMLNQVFGKTKHKDLNQICSTFVGYILSCANVKNLGRDYIKFRPGDSTILPRSFFVTTFRNLDDVKERIGEVDTITKRIYNDNIDEIREYNNIIPKILLKDNIIRNDNDPNKFLTKRVHALYNNMKQKEI